MFKKIFSFLFIAIIFAYLISNIWNNREVVFSIEWNFNFTDVTFLIISIIGVFVSSTVSWHLLTLSLGIKISFKVNLRIWMISNFSRLLPGTVWQYLSRVYLLNKVGVSKTQGVTAVILEGILNLSVASMLFFVTIPFWQFPVSINSYQGWLGFFLALPLILFILSNQKSLNIIFRIMKNLTGKDTHVKEIPVIPIKLLLPLMLIFLTRFITTGLVLFFILRLSQTIPESLWLGLIGIFAFSWVLGYLTLLSPGGLGVVELSLATLLSVYMPFTLAAALAIVFRLSLLLGEIISLLLSINLKNTAKDNL